MNQGLSEMPWSQFLTAWVGLLTAILGSPLLREAGMEWQQNRRWQRFRRELAWRIVDVLGSSEHLTSERARVVVHQALFDAGYRGESITKDLLTAGKEDARGILYDLLREVTDPEQQARIEDFLSVLRPESLSPNEPRLTGEIDEQTGTIRDH